MKEWKQMSVTLNNQKYLFTGLHTYFMETKWSLHTLFLWKKHSHRCPEKVDSYASTLTYHSSNRTQWMKLSHLPQRVQLNYKEHRQTASALASANSNIITTSEQRMQNWKQLTLIKKNDIKSLWLWSKPKTSHSSGTGFLHRLCSRDLLPSCVVKRHNSAKPVLGSMTRAQADITLHHFYITEIHNIYQGFHYLKAKLMTQLISRYKYKWVRNGHIQFNHFVSIQKV